MSMSDQLTLIETNDSLKPLITHLAVGDDPGLERQLITKSRQPAILQYTPKDAAERFGSPARLAAWRAKGRELHWLLGLDRDLAGIIWYGPAKFPLDAAELEVPLPEIPEETFAIRLYEGYAGHGLARPAMQLSLKTYVAHQQARGQKVKGIWLQTDLDNAAAVAVYTKFGYQEVAQDDRRITLVLSSELIAALV